MLHVSQPFIINLFRYVNYIFLISYMVGKLGFSSILNKKHTFGHIQLAKVISAQRLTSKIRIFSIFPWQWAIFTSCKFNLDIRFPLPYEHLVWNYDKADTEKLRNLMSKFTGKIHLITEIPINRLQFSTKLLLIYSQTLYVIG